jgi:hypothetical protein
MGKNGGKIQTTEKIKINDTFFNIYKTRSGLKMIKINNIFYNIYDTKSITNVKNQLLMDKNYESEYVFV